MPICVCIRREYLLWLISNICSQLFHKESCASTRRENSRSLWLIARGALVCSQCPANSAPLQKIPSFVGRVQASGARQHVTCTKQMVDQVLI